MKCVLIAGILCFVLCMSFVNGDGPSSVYDMKCNHTSECVVYPNITQGPEVIWIPLYCNEKNLCVCPNGWIPYIGQNICITKVSGSSTEETCAAYIWAISSLVVTLLTIVTYSCVSLFSKRNFASKLMKNEQYILPASSSCGNKAGK